MAESPRRHVWLEVFLSSKQRVGTVSHVGMSVKDIPAREKNNSYLPGRGDTMIMKVVHPGKLKETRPQLKNIDMISLMGSESKAVTVLIYSDKVRMEDIKVWLSLWCTANSAYELKDEDGIRTGGRRFFVQLKKDSTTGETHHLPPVILLGTIRGFVFYPGQPKVCHKFGSQQHLCRMQQNLLQELGDQRKINNRRVERSKKDEGGQGPLTSSGPSTTETLTSEETKTMLDKTDSAMTEWTEQQELEATSHQEDTQQNTTRVVTAGECGETLDLMMMDLTQSQPKLTLEVDTEGASVIVNLGDQLLQMETNVEPDEGKRPESTEERRKENGGTTPMNPPRAKDSQLKDTQEPENNQLNPITTETLQQTGSLKETPSLEGDGMKKTPRVITIGECGEILEQTMSDLIPSQQEQPQDNQTLLHS
ncbi:hypothetical protein CCH79_00018194 [Gambusia affinis]|uniref:Zinc finger CCHC domain-containing protein n=1 Tax=Gambusia affinis TaxID=33528 RepID=A0A315VHG8_GAMAF|nr:hypothetical protein CCH79_00018194 [Gambusia affinis]